MSNSCGGLDACVPAEIEVVLKEYIRRHNHRPFFDATDEGGAKYSCLLEDLGGARCPDGKCYYNRKDSGEAKPTDIDRSKKPIAKNV